MIIKIFSPNDQWCYATSIWVDSSLLIKTLSKGILWLLLEWMHPLLLFTLWFYNASKLWREEWPFVKIRLPLYKGGGLKRFPYHVDTFQGIRQDSIDVRWTNTQSVCKTIRVI